MVLLKAIFTLPCVPSGSDGLYVDYALFTQHTCDAFRGLFALLVSSYYCVEFLVSHMLDFLVHLPVFVFRPVAIPCNLRGRLRRVSQKKCKKELVSTLGRLEM